MLPEFRRFFQDRGMTHDVTIRDAQRFEDAVSDVLRATRNLAVTDSLLLTGVRLFGARGRIDGFAGGAGPTIVQLSDPRDATLFKVGLNYYASTSDGSWGALKPNFVTCTAVDVVNGTVTASAPWTTITGIAVGDFIWLEDEFKKPSLITHQLNRAPNGFTILSTDHGPATVWRDPPPINGVPNSIDLRQEAVAMRVRSTRCCLANILVM